jgi:hypothetical protein
METQFSFNAAPATDITTAVAPDIAPATSVAPSDVPSTEFQPEVPVIAPQQAPAFNDINVYAESISSSSSNDPSQAVFDMVLTVSWICPATGEYKNAKIVKTVSFCKQSLADQTQAQPVAVVESKDAGKKDISKLLNTMRELAGVPGSNTFV